MFDRWKVIPGLLIFVGLVLSPFWYPFLRPQKGKMPPELDKPKGTECVEDVAYMRTSHMDLLHQWRNSVARDGNRIYTNSKGKQYVMSLQNTCMNCHQSMEKFCGRCHTYLSVSPNCWNCHLTPEFRKPTVARRNQ